jgi:hypothetical protein
MRNRDENYPYPYEQTTFWNNANVRWSPMAKAPANIRKDDLALYFASSGYYRLVILSFSYVQNLLLLIILVVYVQLIARD